MSNTVEVTLTANEYNFAFGLVSKFDGPVSRYIGEKIVSLLQSEVLKNKTGDVMPSSITFAMDRKYFEGFFLGVQEFLSKDGLNSVDVATILEISKVFKISKRVQKIVDDKLGELVDLEPLDDELLDSE